MWLSEVRMWFTIFIIFLNLGIGFGLAYYLKLRYRSLYLNNPTEGEGSSRESGD